MELSNLFTQEHTLADVVRVINEGGTADYNSHEIAAQYAWIAANESIKHYDVDFVEECEAQLEILENTRGAKFDADKALRYIKNGKVISGHTEEDGTGVFKVDFSL